MTEVIWRCFSSLLCLDHVVRRLLQLYFVFRTEEGHGQVAVCSKCWSTSGQRDTEILWDWSLSADAWKCTGWLFVSECSTSLLWQSIVVFGVELHGTSPTTVCQSPKFLVASICDLPDVINCQFREFAVAPLRPVHFLSPDQQPSMHCLIICRIKLLTPHNFGGPDDVYICRTFEALAD